MNHATTLSPSCNRTQARQNEKAEVARHRKRRAKLHATSRDKERKRIGREPHDELHQQVNFNRSTIETIRAIPFGAPIDRLQSSLENTSPQPFDQRLSSFTLSDTLPDSPECSGMCERSKRRKGSLTIFSHFRDKPFLRIFR